MKASNSTAHLQRSVPVIALVAAILRLRFRREAQLELELKQKGTSK